MTKYKFGNDFVSLTVYLELKDTLEEACAAAKKTMDKMKRSMIPAGGYTLCQMYTTFLPHYFMDFIYNKSAGPKHSLLFSNVPGFLKPVYYGGKPAKRFFSLITGCGNIATGINIVSMPEIAQMSITTDNSCIEDIDVFVRYFDNCILELGI